MSSVDRAPSRCTDWVSYGKSPSEKHDTQQSVTSKKSYRVQAARAHQDAVKAMQLHVNMLVSTRQTLRRTNDEAGREYSALTFALREAEETIGTLKARQMAHEECLVEFAVLSPFAQCSPTKVHELETEKRRGGGATGSSGAPQGGGLPKTTAHKKSHLHQHADPRDDSSAQKNLNINNNSNSVKSSSWSRVETYRKRSGSAKAASSEAQRSLAHGRVLQRHIDAISEIVSSSKAILGEIAVRAREIKHMMVLVDRATDVEMQCMGQGAFSATRTASTFSSVPLSSFKDSLADLYFCTSTTSNKAVDDGTVLVNASPLYPSLRVEDADAVIKACSDVNVKAGRATTLVKRAIAAAIGEISESSTSLVNVMKVGAKCAKEKFSQAKRTVAGIAWEEQLLQKRLQKAHAEETALVQRLELIGKSVQMRETSGLALDQDGVAASLLAEAQALEQRLGELQRNSADIVRSLQAVDHERRQLQMDVEEAASSSALFHRIATSASVTPVQSAPVTPRVTRPKI